MPGGARLAYVPGYVLAMMPAEGPETVRAVQQASLVPFASIEPAVELRGLG